VLARVTISPRDRIADIVGKIFARRSIARTAQPDDDLGEMGLSSLDMVNLMLAVEAEFAIKIPDKDMTPSNFRSIARIDTLVTALMPASHHA
jgi:acyl carrier protein